MLPNSSYKLLFENKNVANIYNCSYHGFIILSTVNYKKNHLIKLNYLILILNLQINKKISFRKLLFKNKYNFKIKMTLFLLFHS